MRIVVLHDDGTVVDSLQFAQSQDRSEAAGIAAAYFADYAGTLGALSPEPPYAKGDTLTPTSAINDKLYGIRSAVTAYLENEDGDRDDDLAFAIYKAIKATAEATKANPPLVIERVLNAGTLSSFSTFDELIDAAGGALDSACAHDIFGEVVFLCNDRKFYTITCEGIVGQLTEQKRCAACGSDEIDTNDHDVLQCPACGWDANAIRAEYVSVYDSQDEVRTSCWIDPTQSPPRVWDIGQAQEPDDRPDIVNEEYIYLPGGNLIKTFTTDDERHVVDGQAQETDAHA